VKAAATPDRTPNPSDEASRVSCLRENLTCSSEWEGLETGRYGWPVPRQVSFKAALQMLNPFERNLRHCPHGRPPGSQHLLAGIAQLKLPHRPGRVEPRAVKRRPKPHRLLTKPQPIARAGLRKIQQNQVAAFSR